MIAGRKKATGGAKGATSTTRRYLAGLLLYSTNGVAASFIHMSSLAIVLLRTLLGFLLLTAIFYGSGGRLRGEKRKDCVFVLLSGAAMILGGTAVLELREKRSDPLFCGTFPRHTMP